MASAFAQNYLDEHGRTNYGLVNNVVINGEKVPSEETILIGSMAKIETILLTKQDLKKSQTEKIDFSVNVDHCSGTLIGPDIVLTAAHCIGPNQWEPGISVTINSEVYTAKYVKRHYRYTPVITLKDRPDEPGIVVGPYNDIALVFLSEKVRNVQTPLLPQPGLRLNDGEEVYLVGFGVTEKAAQDQGFASGELNQLNWTKAPAVESARAVIIIPGDRTVCSGDSGGAAFIREGDQYIIVGVAAASNCASEARLTRVSDFIGWIRQEVENHLTARDI